jgi:hypothetical protein
MNKALDFLLKYYIIYPNVLEIGTKCTKNLKKYILRLISGVIKRIPRCLSKQNLRLRFHGATEYLFMLNNFCIGSDEPTP